MMAGSTEERGRAEAAAVGPYCHPGREDVWKKASNEAERASGESKMFGIITAQEHRVPMIGTHSERKRGLCGKRKGQ